MSYKKMNPKFKEKWVKALRSGRYKQGFSQLKFIPPEGKPKYCCLGVLATTLRVKWEMYDHKGSIAKATINGKDVRTIHSYGDLSGDMQEAVGLSRRSYNRLIQLNDDKGYNFNQIADWIENNL